ncbi:MAG: ATP-binding cassette domain-containing protein [Acidobacteria bacterium]|nr:ATP-binding cassette domain-containing protein [Acidobacteriota bacterium]
MSSTPSVSLAFKRLYRSFDRLSVLEDVSGSVATGEVLLITGSNGCGKSTLLKCLAGLLAPDQGEIEYQEAGESLPIEARRRHLGFASPDLAFYDELTVAENLAFFARMRRCPPSRAGELLEHVGLPGSRMGHALSSGMRQRLRWCWALLHRPRLLLLDEPFQNLDEPGRRAATRLLEDHLADGAAVVANPGSLDLPYVTRHLELAD